MMRFRRGRSGVLEHLSWLMPRGTHNAPPPPLEAAGACWGGWDWIGIDLAGLFRMYRDMMDGIVFI